MEFFGLTIKKAEREEVEKPSSSFALPIDDEGAGLVAAASSAAYYGVYVDISGMAKDVVQGIQKCREIALFPEVDIALQDIINEAIPQEDDTSLITLDLDDLDFSDTLKDKIQAEFKRVITLLDYTNLASDLFRRWYIDGRLFFHIIVDKSNLKRGIIELRMIEATKIRKMKEVKKKKSESGIDVIDQINEFFVYNETGFMPTTANATATTTQAANAMGTNGIKLSTDAIVYVPSGYVDGNSNNVLSYLQKAIRPANQLRMLEDATVVYFIARAPERRIFYVDVGNLPKLKAEQYLKEIMNKYRNKMVYDSTTGAIKDDKRYQSMLEDFWMPRRDSSKGTEITTLPGALGLQGQLDSLGYFKKKLYESLNVPVSRLEPSTGFSLGRSGEITRDELKFQKFIDRLRRKFSQLFYDVLKTQLVLKGICNSDEWETIYKEAIKIKFQTDNSFSELKNQELVTNRMALLPQVDQYLAKFFSKKWIQKNILQLSNEDIEQMDKEIEEEKDDPTAKPSMMQDPNAMQPPGADDTQGGFGQDPYRQDQDDQSQQNYQQEQQPGQQQ